MMNIKIMDTPAASLGSLSGILVALFFVAVLTYYCTCPSRVRKRSRAALPNNFRNFIKNRIIPSFKGQRVPGKNQFAVLLLLSERDLADITSMSFNPHNYLNQPLVDKSYLYMPRDSESQIGNYIVARPSHNEWHSEDVIFSALISSSLFSRLWDAYKKYNGHSPKCILLYSWNLPCSRCTKLIIRSLNDRPYSETSVIVAYNAHWSDETEFILKMFENERIDVVRCYYCNLD